jgi:hypothetical protein
VLGDTVNPIAMFPPPRTVQEGEDRMADGIAVSRHVVSLVNPPAEPVTTVPVDPDVGSSVTVSAGPNDARKVEVAVSLAPRFVVTVTVYEVPTIAVDATVNPLPALRLPEESAHDEDVKRPDGKDVIWHVVPA